MVGDKISGLRFVAGYWNLCLIPSSSFDFISILATNGAKVVFLISILYLPGASRVCFSGGVWPAALSLFITFFPRWTSQLTSTRRSRRTAACRRRIRGGRILTLEWIGAVRHPQATRAHLGVGGSGAVNHAGLGLVEGGGRFTDDINFMLAHMLVGARAFVFEELGVLIGDHRHHIVIGARHDDLAGMGETHDALRDIDAGADDIGLRASIPKQRYA